MGDRYRAHQKDGFYLLNCRSNLPHQLADGLMPTLARDFVSDRSDAAQSSPRKRRSMTCPNETRNFSELAKLKRLKCLDKIGSLRTITLREIRILLTS